MKKILEIALGIVTSIGGFLDVGAIATAAEAGSIYGFQLIWVIILGTICVIFLVEMSGRLAAVSKHTLAAAVRERFGFNFYVLPLFAEIIVDFLVLAAEIGGVCIALQLLTGISFQWFALPVAFAIWLLLWKGTFGLIENGISLLGLITLVFVFATFKLHPSLTEIGSGLLPTLPKEDTAHYLFIAVSILGALISPYLFYFYSSGAVEDKWDEGHIGVNRAVASLGMGFGSIVSLGVLIVAALVLKPKGIEVDSYEQAALMLTDSLGYWGFVLFALSLGIACFGAALEVTLDTAYIVAQAFGWNWGENLKPKDAARFSLVYTVFVFLASLLMVFGIDPLQLTLFSMAITAVILPPVIVPFLVLMNDKLYVGKYRNGWISNGVVIFTIVLAFVMAIVAIPLEFIGG
ncbi:natural resistance-associated macrophage protein [Tolypothrix tenuis PCC 7101]|uniref:Natural resistance-associated macrophage protein n=1 Tax=Tolypothrix tenuis PCC 7101 TaxID=231146 RepID=A0A1Z4MYZ4_9CYAN|nr:divalent metal cation transporter [Aulosira sp. FACHB-113]BAY98689.1 natural resistance-associated macrophage protein [Tolypothrix tenuis PCC 7101]BAZ77394.1 natural resistance-associated macrophage protein [Aulosira laxa NIES-50]